MSNQYDKVQLRKRLRFFSRRVFSKPVIKEKIIIAIVVLIFAIYALSLVYPFLYLINNSFKSSMDIMGYFNPLTGEGWDPNYFGFPRQIIFDNYMKAFDNFQVGTVNTNIFKMYFHTITLSIGETAVSMAMTCAAAYVLAKYEFRGNKVIYTIVLISSFIPAIASLPATFRLMQDTKLISTYVGMIILNASAFGGAFLYIHSYFKAIPWSFAESAMLDGASDFRVFKDIMFPLAKNGIITFTILKFLGFWNDYWYPQLFYSNRPTIAVGIASLQNEQIQFVSAVMVLAVVPTLIFYALTQKQLLRNTIDGGLK